MADMYSWFQRIKNEIQCEISFPDKFRLAQYEETDGLCYIVGEISKSLDFFIDLGDEKLHFVQDGDISTLDSLDIEKPFWAIEKFSQSKDPFTGRYPHILHYYPGV